MAYYDVLSAGSYGRYNRKFCHIAGLNTAVYISEVMDIVRQVVKKKKYDDNGYFKLDRNYVLEETSLSLEDQLDCDSVLETLGIIEKDVVDANKLRVNLAAMEHILTDDEIQINIPKLKISRKQKSANKAEVIISTLKKCAAAFEPDEELAELYKNWVESAYVKGMCSKAQIKTFIDKVNSFTSDKALKSEIIVKATSLAYKDADWAINALKLRSNLVSEPNIEQKVASIDDINKSESF